MGMILEFHHPDADGDGVDAARENVKQPMGRSAEIIIFPGVRIERHRDPDTPTAAPKTKKRAKRMARRKS